MRRGATERDSEGENVIEAFLLDLVSPARNEAFCAVHTTCNARRHC